MGLYKTYQFSNWFIQFCIFFRECRIIKFFWEQIRHLWFQISETHKKSMFQWLFSVVQFTTRTPAFWEYPTAPWVPILMFHIGSLPFQVKTRQSQTYKFKELPKIQILEFFNKLNTQETFWSYLIRYMYMNMKWIQQVHVLWKIQSGHDFVHRWTNKTDGQGETTFNFVEDWRAGGSVWGYDTTIHFLASLG